MHLITYEFRCGPIYQIPSRNQQQIQELISVDYIDFQCNAVHIGYVSLGLPLERGPCVGHQ